ncbi:MAG: histidine phosphatase family protein [Geminicoccaceae bacterium]
MPNRRDLVTFLCLAAVPRTVRAQAAGEEALWARLRAGGVALLMRHAQTEPGTGDPPGFRLDDCGTQRNLDARGRAQARAWGAALRQHRVAIAGVYTSAWCRCRETASLMEVGEVVHLPALDSFFEARDRREAQTQALETFIAGWQAPGTLLLVTHQVNVTALTGLGVRSGEAVILAASGEDIEVLGRLRPPSAA